MTNQQHPITPPPKLVEEWAHMLEQHTDTEVFSQVARWGADVELEACVEWVVNTRAYDMTPGALRAARRPKPLSLKAQALSELNLTADPDGAELSRTQVELIRRALEALDD